MDHEKRIRRILVVDDQEIVRKVISGIMAHHGHVDLAENGQDALALYADALKDGWGYDLICMDVLMHGLLNGNQVVRCIRVHEEKLAIEKPVPVVMISAHSDPDDVAKSQELCGANDYIVKPFDQARIEEVIQRYLY
jgi:two-component system, chemotaxis family, chemotaxis protein CheY